MTNKLRTGLLAAMVTASISMPALAGENGVNLMPINYTKSTTSTQGQTPITELVIDIYGPNIEEPETVPLFTPTKMRIGYDPKNDPLGPNVFRMEFNSCIGSKAGCSFNSITDLFRQ